MIQHEATVEIKRPTAEVFAFIDDFAKSHLWLESCVSLAQESPFPRREGSSIRYVYREGATEREMLGVVSKYHGGQDLVLTLSDARFEVQFAVVVTASSSGSLVTHRIAIVPKTLSGKLFSKVIAPGNRRQVQANLRRLAQQFTAQT